MGVMDVLQQQACSGESPGRSINKAKYSQQVGSSHRFFRLVFQRMVEFWGIPDSGNGGAQGFGAKLS